MAVQHLPRLKPFPSGDSLPLAALRMDVSEIAAKYGLESDQASDDLGSHDFLIISLGKDRGKDQNALLLEYHVARDLGTQVLVDSQANLPKIWERLRRMLELSDESVLWLSPDAAPR